jgi:hypothetical protein
VLLTFAVILNVIIILKVLKYLNLLFTFQLATAVAKWIFCSLPENIRIQNPKSFPKDFLLSNNESAYLHGMCSGFRSFSVYDRLASRCAYVLQRDR